MVEAQKLLESNCISHRPIQSITYHNGEKQDVAAFQPEQGRGGIAPAKEDRVVKGSKDVNGKSSLRSSRDLPPHTHYDFNNNMVQSPSNDDIPLSMQQRKSEYAQDLEM
mmetsp:Transcript_2658/g.4959  ORF Transcript_2658/g.4959 Transcript_2658/m.4959 type:complete len:109 (-) Transcript_2658:729-1055(-)